MSVEIDLSGGNIPGLPKKMEIKNAAQEETLKEILKLMQQQQKLSEKSLRAIEKGAATKGGGAGSGLTGKATKANEQAQQGAAKAANNNAGAMKKTGIGLGIMTAAVVRNAAALNTLAIGSANLIKAFSGVGDSLSSAASELGKIPVVGSLLSATLGAVAGAAEDVYKSYTTLAATGASFDGSMRAMVSAATGAGLTFDQFTGILAKNSHALMLLGGTTEQGAKRFSDISKSLKNSGLSDQLLKMGYTTEEVNDGMAGYIGIIGKTGALDKMSTEQVAQGSASYLKELDALAKITGKTRAEKQKEHDALMRDAQFRALTARMTAEEQQQMMSFVTSFPESSQGAIKDMLASGTATTEAAVKFNAMNSKGAQEAMRLGQALRRGEKVTQQQLDRTRNITIQEAKIAEQRFRDQGIYNKDMSEAYLAQSDLARMEEDGRKKALEEQEAVANQTEALATNIGKLKQDIAKTSNKFTVELLDDTAIASLRMAFTSMGEFVNAFVLPIFKLTVAVISPFVTLIGGVVKIISKTLSPIFNTLADAVRGVANMFNDAVGPMLDWVAENTKVLTALVSVYILSKVAQYAYTAGVIAATLAKKAYTLALTIAASRQAAAGVASNFLGGRLRGLGGVVRGLGSVVTGAGSAIKGLGGAVSVVGGGLMKFSTSAIGVVKGMASAGSVLAIFGKIAAGFMGALAFVGKGIALAGAVIASPAIAIGAAIAAAAAGIYMVVKYWDEIVGFISNIGAKLKEAFFSVLDSIKKAASKLNPLNWFKSDKEDTAKANKSFADTNEFAGMGEQDTSQSSNESSAETAKLLRQNNEPSAEMKRSLKLAEMWSEGEDDSEAIEVGEKQLAAANRLAQGMGKLDQSNKLLNETIIESNELAEDEKDEKDKKSGSSKPSSSGKPTTPGNQTGQSSSTASKGSSPGRPSARSGSISDDIPSMTPSGGSGPSSDTQSSSGSKKAPSASGGKDGASAGKKTSSGGQDGGAGGSGGGGGGTKPQSTGRPTGKGGTMSEEDTKAMIIEHEGIRYEPYKDSLGLWTVGVGHLIGDGKTLPPEYNRKFSHEEVMAMFEKDYEKHKKQAQSNVPGFGKYDSLGQAALVDLTFNMGPGWPKKFKNTSAKLAAGDTAGAAEGLTNSKWYTQVGRRAPIITGMIRESKVSAAEGGVFNGPKSGYPATLHGEEAVVPLKGGNIPVEMGGNASQTEMINLLSALNSKMEHLVALNSAIADLNSSQLKAQKKMGNTELLV
jgi:lysozyme